VKRRIAVFCGASPGTDASMMPRARRFGEALAWRGFGLVYGGASVGLMGAVADGALAAKGEVIGVLPHSLATKEIAHHGLAELLLVSTMHDRKAAMASRADAFVALPGGFGTLDELFEALTWAQLGLHEKPCALLSWDDFYAPLVAFVDYAVTAGFVKAEHRQSLWVEKDDDALLDRLTARLGQKALIHAERPVCCARHGLYEPAGARARRRDRWRHHRLLRRLPPGPHGRKGRRAARARSRDLGHDVACGRAHRDVRLDVRDVDGDAQVHA
jgi:hypothetical protein